MAYGNRSRHSYSRRGGGRGGRRRGDGSLLMFVKLLMIILVPLGALVGGGFLAMRQLNTEQIAENFCYGRDDQYDEVFFVDFSLTGGTSGSQQRDLVNEMLATFANLPANGRLAVFTTARGSTSTRNVPVFTLCNPADTAQEQADIGAPALNTPRLTRINEEADAVFAAFVDGLVAQSVDASQMARTSPILEQIRGISRYGDTVGLDRLVVYSDGINNSPVARFCAEQGHLPRFEVFAQRADWREVVPDDFGGADIEILMVEGGTLPAPGLEHCTNRELRDFWVDYYEANGAGRVRLTPLGYGSGS